MYKKTIAIVAAALVSMAPAAMNVAHATTHAAARANLPQPVAGVSVAEAQGKILSVNRDTREVVVDDGNGGKVAFVAGPEVKNFAQINAGDEVRVRLTRELEIAVSKGGGLRAGAVTDAVAGAPLGAKPAGEMARQVSIVADIVKVDQKGGIVTVKGPQGNVLDVQVRDRTKLAEVKAGDQVMVNYTSAVSVAVLPK
jgi:hypothetical protein